MVYAGSLPFLMIEWGMSALEAGAIQAAFNIGYAISLFVCSWASDHIGPRRVFLGANFLSLVAFAACAFWAHSPSAAMPLFAILALALGGAYTPAIMLVARHVEPERRGRGVGWILAGSSLGYFLAIALCAALIPHIGYRALWLALTASQLIALCAAFRAVRFIGAPIVVPQNGGAAPSFWSALRERNSLLLTGGYTAHCWELLGMWAWMPAFLALSLSGGEASPGWLAAIAVAASLHLSGALSTMVGGFASDRWGRKPVLIMMAAAGALCSVTIGWLPIDNRWLLLFAAALYGFAVLGDSGVLSAAMTEAVPPAQLGSMLAFRSILGFGAGAISPLVFGWVLDTTNVAGQPPQNWGWAFVALGGGGILATLAALSLRRTRPPTS